MSGDSILGWLRMFLSLTLIWILASITVECQECSTSGSNVFGGYQYVFYHGVHKTFSDTRALCQSLGGDMPIITSAGQNAFIATRLPTRYGNYYIGLEGTDKDDEYKWIDGMDPEYTNWDSSLNNPDKPYCAVMRSSGNSSVNGLWNRVTCTSTRKHICQIPIDDYCRWQELGESQYLIKFAPRATPSAARETCQSYGGDLAIIKTAEVNNFLKALLPPFNPSDPYFCFLFGLSRSGRGTFYWLDDTALDPRYNDWYTATEPNEADTWGCLGTRGGPWYDQVPQLSSPYICERTRVSDKNSEASFGGLDYFTSPSWLARSFSDARTYCQYHGADLALIKSHDINTFLHVRNSEEYSGSDDQIFFGLTDQADEGTFIWIDGTPLQYSSWKSPEPNGENNENCASLLPSNPNMGWDDASCNGIRPFICERYQDVPENEWSRLDGTLYYISQSSMTSYSFARKYCQDQGGDLAQPKTNEINMHLIQLAGGNSYWFGLDDINQEGTFQWIDGTPLNNSGFPGWSNGDATLFQNERCVHQKVTNGWRKLPCTSYSRFACEKPPSPRQILPVRLMAATPSPYGGGQVNSSFVCLLGSENEEFLTLSTRRLVRLTEAINSDSYTAPGDSNGASSVVLRQTLPTTMDGLGFYECSAVTASRITSAPLGILPSTRQWQPSDGRFTKTVHVGDDITLSVMSTTGMVGEDRIRWRKITDVDWANSLIGMSSGSLTHTIQSASVSDAGVYVTYEDGTLEQHQFSFIRLIVKECPYGRWNPPLCDRLCDSCYNGGVCHELSGTCICPPGHAGKNCLQGKIEKSLKKILKPLYLSLSNTFFSFG
ncbi:macrophage mannose receptor 1 [Strongylocentrotus purpuratus]|uniref:Uncharacterized protein n=1 Tax=Strongylocentrotus purpuratus TaxID=7668 RepID=A0A7M7PMR6_STRPU|nr:macrophage mannose receptor 1 [Strongylocentrotus purpuratus]